MFSVNAVKIDYEAQRISVEDEAGEKAACRILGRRLLDEGRVFTIISNLTGFKRRAPSADLARIVAIVDDYLANVLPQFEAIEGKLSYGEGGQVITTDDGQTFDNRHKAALHVLQTRLGALFADPTISLITKQAICNANHYRQDDPALKQWSFDYRLGDFFRLTTDRGLPFKGQELRFRNAMQAIIDARS